jgi:pyridoxine/pyridoxamine 5'-phosphate oxidase
MSEEDPVAVARAIVDANSYMTIATADADGDPWASPVWFATADRREFVWVSDPAARHSRNIAVRPRVTLVVFDSHSPIGTGRGVYVAASAAQLDGADAERAIGVFSRASVAQGASAWSLADVRGDARLRLYAAVAREWWVGGRDDRRIPVAL